MNLPGKTVALGLLVTAKALAGPDVVRPNAAESGFSDPEGRLEVSVNGRAGELINRVGTDGLETRIEADDAGNATRRTLPSGAIYESAFDERGNRVVETDVTLGGMTSFAYEPEFNRIIGIVDPFGELTEMFYDLSGNLTRLVTPIGREVLASYQARGLPERTTDTLGTQTTITYDTSVNPIQSVIGTGPESRQSQLTYTAEGYIDTLTDAEGRIFDADYDIMGRLTRMTLPDGRTIGYGYDGIGNVTSITPPGRDAYGFVYDNVDQVIAQTYPAVIGGGTNQTDYQYNRARQITRMTRADGVEINYTYDAAGRLETAVLPRGSYTYTYGAETGLLDSVASPDGITETYIYDNDLLTQVTWSGAIAGSVGYAYDAKGRLSTLTIEGEDFTYAYNEDDDLIQAGALTLTYDAVTGLRSGTTLDTIEETFEYNEFAERTRHTVTAGMTTLYDVEYMRDKLGRITRKVETIQGSSSTFDYTYDLAGRLETVSEDTVLTATYTYDSNNNRLNNGATYDAQDRLISQTGITYDHNAHGERIRRTEGANITDYHYDAEGTLIGVMLPGGDQIDYLLDGSARRSARQVNDTVTEAWLYGDALEAVARLDGGNTVNQRYIYGDRANVPGYIKTPSETYKVVADHLGSVRLVIDASDGTVVQRIDYDAWGEITLNTNANFQPFAYAGGHLDPDTQLTQFGFREYDGSTARWTRKDPIGFEGSYSNLFQYVSSDPINWVDPSGMEEVYVLTRIEGTVRYRFPGDSWRSISARRTIRLSGDCIFQTAPDGIAQVEYAGGIFLIGKNSKAISMDEMSRRYTPPEVLAQRAKDRTFLGKLTLFFWPREARKWEKPGLRMNTSSVSLAPRG